MATTSAQHRWTYDVFISFRGEDIRKSFMDHLFKDFKQKGIHAFRDDNQLPRGEEISSQLYKAIEESRILIVIFSKNYSSSSWCLRELVKIIECKQMGEYKHEVQIIFYDVKPDVVRKQTESYAEAFLKHELSNRREVAKWKEALIMASNLSGWDLQGQANGYESKLIDSISKEILVKLCDGPLHVGENLVGVDVRIEKMNLLRFVRSNKVHMIGICGIGGIGKTTLAKAIYNLLYIHFEECSFLDDVQGATKRHGLIHVVIQLINDIMKTREVRISSIGQGIMVIKQRIASRRILLVLDDVSHHDQLEALAGSCGWFFPGSLILFTSKDKQLLANKVDEIHEMEFLDDDESLKLFSLYAFHEKHPTNGFQKLSKNVVHYVQGHPLALKILGCFLHGKNMQEWNSELDSLQVVPNEDIHRVLRLGYDGLNREQQKIFLDIACSFIGEKRDFVARVLDGCNYFADTNIRVLIDKSLITICRIGSLQMHGLIQRMAREMVREESSTPGKWSRLFSSEDYDVMIENKATEAVEVLNLLLKGSGQKVCIDCKDFSHMKNLRILKIYHPELREFWLPFELNHWKHSKVNYSGRLHFLSNKLRLLYWHGCPSKFFPSDFYPENIVAVDLSYSHIRNLWTTPKCFRRLKVMKLRYCLNLTSTPNFTRITNLEELILDGCENLVKVHSSFGMLKRLVILSMIDCKRFRSFPTKVELDSLEVMNLSRCSKLDKLPKSFGTIRTLKEFRIDGTSITQLPSFVFTQSNLRIWNNDRDESIWSRQPSWFASKMQHPQSLAMLSLAGLCSLRRLNLTNCNILEVSNSIGDLLFLEDLVLSENDFISLPGCLSRLLHLVGLNISRCKKLEVLPELPFNLSYISARHCTSLQKLQGPLNYKYPPTNMDCIECPKLFQNLEIKTQVSISQCGPDLNSSITSLNFRNQLSSFFRYYMNFPTTTSGIFSAQERSFKDIYMDIKYHGNRIPRWFTNRSMENHVKVELPRDWCFSKFRGYGICVVFRTLNDFYEKPMYRVDNFDGTSLVDSCPLYDQFIGIPKSYVIWFRFMTKDYQRWATAKNFVTFSFKYGCNVKVKECGVRLVMDEDIGEETNFSITEDLPTPTQDGGIISLEGDFPYFEWSW